MLWIDRVGNRRSWAILARYFSVENWGQAQRKIRTKKERKRRPVETDAAVEIRSQRGFPQRLGKHKTLSTVPTRPDGDSTDLIHQQGGAKSNDRKGPNQVDVYSLDRQVALGSAPLLHQSACMPLGKLIRLPCMLHRTTTPLRP